MSGYLILDLSIIFMSFLASDHLASGNWVPFFSRSNYPQNVGPLGSTALASCMVFTATMVPVLVYLLCVQGLYETRRGVRYSTELHGVVRSVWFSMLFAIALDFLVWRADISRHFVVYEASFMCAGLFTWRYFKRKYFERLVSAGYRRTPALIIGAGRLGRYLEMIMARKDWLGVDVVGYLDDRYGVDDNGPAGLLGRISDFEPVVRLHGIREVYVTIPSERKVISRLLDIACDLGVTVKVVPEMYDLVASEVKFENVGSIPIMRLRVPALRPRQILAKRALELALTVPLILLFSPVMVLIALAVKLDSEGSVFYKQKVLGFNGRPLVIYKFRSMRRDADDSPHKAYLKRLVNSNEPADEVNGLYKLVDDDRITRVGRILRKYSLDELPQLINVLRGDLSLVGPRPPIVFEYAQYNDFHKKRLLVKPGLTGLWQVSGKSRLSFEEMIMLDILYINEWSIWLDLRIILDTIPVVLRGRNL